MQDILSQISNLGFPIVISVYLLVRIENKLDSLTRSINELARVIDTFKALMASPGNR
ncbi:YvrJ family protein [Caldanaerobius polysaccharolyticus]|uniref:YvrJ family protein n=1 Tax=Caldanaerobius polysaccharolyticus TaxID=44256 RepID=UPI0009FF5C6E|nr:YvrJ family protein [Caldanaerobius polysaccharolyticus]